MWNVFVFHSILLWTYDCNTCNHVIKSLFLPALIKGQYYKPMHINLNFTLSSIKITSTSSVATTSFFFLFSFADARFFDLSSTYYSDKRQSAAQFWQLWFKSTPLYSNRPGQKPYNGDIFRGKGSGGRKKPATLRPEVTPTIGVFFRTDSQFSVEQSVATKVYEQSSYGRSR